MLKEIEAVIFDIDGTLVDSMWLWHEIDDIFLEKYHLTAPETFHKGMEGKSYTETAQYFLDIFPTLTHTIEELKEEWNEMAHELYMTKVQLKTGAYEFIEFLCKKNIKLGIATSNCRMLAEDSLACHNILKCMDSIWTADEAKVGKPAPDVYLKVAESLGVNPVKCLVFEDVPNGIMAGKNAGMKVCAVYDEASANQDDLKRELADYYIQDFNDIKNNTYEVL